MQTFSLNIKTASQQSDTRLRHIKTKKTIVSKTTISIIYALLCETKQ